MEQNDNRRTPNAEQSVSYLCLLSTQQVTQKNGYFQMTHDIINNCLFCQDLVKPQIQFPFLSLNKGRFNCIGQVFLFHPISSSVAISTNILKQYEKKIQNKKSKRREEFVLETSQEDLLTRSIIPV